MSQVGAYFDRIFLTALASPQVKRVEKVRQEEDAMGQIGFMRYRLTLSNDDLLELTEYVEVQAGTLSASRHAINGTCNRLRKFCLSKERLLGPRPGQNPIA